ncbi:MAG: helix-turn-helix domain-containing protein [Defluviitaleaceae bacterium]|nr:helix-turn-helix domain-containing protein [Defluviitaleaceae bacterium]MCL2275471.1 helix-turn-helix domain-containing protein [Defluviitaleaceae bacterium]
MKSKKSLDVHVGQQIKKAREAAGYTQDKFAELIGMGTKNVSAIERGAVGVSLSTIKRICESLCISSDSLIMDEPCSANIDKTGFLMERIKLLPPKYLELMLDINNKLFEAFTLQKNDWDIGEGTNEHGQRK